MIANFKWAVALTFFACCTPWVVAEAYPIKIQTITEEITGSGTAAQRRRVAELLEFIADMSRQPTQLTIRNVVSKAGADFETPLCLTREDGIRRCSYADTSGEFVVRLNYLDTFTLKDESDSGARVKMELNPQVVCLRSETLSKLLHVLPVKRQMPLQDFFAGSKDVEEPEQITVELYSDVIPAKPYIFVQTHSTRGCVESLNFSAVPPSTF